MADQNTNPQQNMVPVDPFTLLMWGRPPGTPSFMPMASQNMQPIQNQSQNQIHGQTQQDASGPAMPNAFNANGFDFNKLMDGADKMFKLINQTQPMIKQLGPLFNLFK